MKCVCPIPRPIPARLRVAGAGAVALLVVAMFPCQAGAAILFGQVDDFQDGTPVGWVEGFSSPNPPTNVATGGPRGAGDRFLSNDAAGGFGAGGRQVMFNPSQWAGDYTAAGVTRIDGMLANFGPTDLHMRVALTSSNGTVFASTEAAVLPSGGGWRRVSFDLTGGGLTRVSGAQTLGQVLASVRELRVLSAAGSPNHRGDPVASVLGADDFRAMRQPGDANFDGGVDAADLRVLRSNLGRGAAGATWREGDFNFDGRVNAIDLALLRQNLGRPVAAAGAAIGAVPEPGVAMIVVGWAVVLLRRVRLRD